MKRTLALGIVVAIFASLPSAFAATPKARATCTEVGATSTYAGKKFTCVKSGKKLVWNRGVTVRVPKPVATPTPTPTPRPTPTPTPTPTVKKDMVYLPPSEPSANLNLCKIKEVSRNRQDLPSGFPIRKSLTPRNGTVKWALIPIDFKDLPGEANPLGRVENQMKLLSEWYYMVSGGKLKVEWVVSDKWITLPGLSTEYKIQFSDTPPRSPEIASFANRAITQTDIYFDYTNVQVVNFILPKGQTIVRGFQGFPWEKYAWDHVTKEGSLDAFTVTGDYMDQPGREYWSFWAHEFAHAIGIPHIGSSLEWNPFQGLELSSGQDGPTRELTGWLRFLVGWLPDEKVYCQEFSSLGNPEITLVPLNDTEEGIKLVVIALSESRALILESRRVNKFGCTTPTLRNGVLAYIYDAKLGHNEDFLIPVAPAGRPVEGSSCWNHPDIDPLLREGEKIIVEGVSIEVLLHGKYDRIKISRSNTSANPFASAAEKVAAEKVAASITCPVNGKCEIGNTGPGGGIVFYVAPAPQSWGQYLEFAPANWNGTSTDPKVPWCDISNASFTNLVTDPELKKLIGYEIGKGRGNTQLMSAYCKSGAANLATAYRGGGKSDWFLPSKDELNQMYVNKTTIGGFATIGYSWSSSENHTDSKSSAWWQGFKYGNQSTDSKAATYYVRPVRAFS